MNKVNEVEMRKRIQEIQKDEEKQIKETKVIKIFII
jgi:hypothetical protein